MMPTARLPRFIAFLFATLLGLLALGAHAADEPLPAEEAFRASARLIDNQQVEIRFQVADGYYLYRHSFKFAADGISYGEPALPPGKLKNDDTAARAARSGRFARSRSTGASWCSPCRSPPASRPSRCS